LATPTQLATLIRSALRDLDGVNAHHEFEHLCRQLAMHRIARNVLPATGPVSAGGDHGRDFETYRSYLADGLPFAIGFLALASTDTIAFGCTIQKDKLKSKIQSDISAICGQGTVVDRVYIFATAKVPVRLRHDLQEWAKDHHNVALDVLDGVAVAEMLSQPDLYWIAQQYLHLPPELAPHAPEKTIGQLDLADLPPAHSVADIALWGIHPAIPLAGPVPEDLHRDLPSYIPRDADSAVREALRSMATTGGFLLLVGRAASGKTRLAYEAVKEVTPYWRLFLPAAVSDVSDLSRSDLGSGQIVVWLDDLERFLEPGQLSSGVVHRLIGDPNRPVVIIGTTG
jgi:hypothetical protein